MAVAAGVSSGDATRPYATPITDGSVGAPGTAVLQYRFNSKTAAPGRGAGEVEGTTPFSPGLPSHFRSVLSNFHSSGKPFLVEVPADLLPEVRTVEDVVTVAAGTIRFGVLTAEHAWHACKFFAAHKVEYAMGFLGPVPSVGELGSDAKRAGGKRGCKLDKAGIEEWDRVRSAVVWCILRCKFRNVDEARRVLLLTGDAVLVHDMGRGKKEVSVALMAIRDGARASAREDA